MSGLNIKRTLRERSALLYKLILVVLCSFVIRAHCQTLSYSIHGLPDKIEENVQNLLLLDLKKRMPLTDERIQAAYQQAPEVIQKGVEPFGYFHAEITPRRLHQASNSEWHASFSVKLGPVVKITRLNVQVVGPGHVLRPIRKALKTIPLKLGQNFNMEKYDDTKTHLLDAIAEQGFLSGGYLFFNNNLVMFRVYLCYV